MAFGGKTFGGKTFAGYQSTGRPTILPGSTAPAVAYLYLNAGLGTGPDIDAVAYLYENVGVPGFVHPYVGAVHPLLNDMYAVAYLYENVT